MRRRAKVDANQREITLALRAIGASVQPIHTLGRGVPDLLVGHCGRNVLLEIKPGELPPSARALTADELRWHDEWRGQVAVVLTVDDALRVVQG